MRKKLLPSSIIRRTYLFISLLVIGASFIQIAIDALGWYQHEFSQNEQLLSTIAQHLDRNFPGSFAELVTDPNQPASEQVRQINAKLQPIVDELAKDYPGLGMGYYDRALDTIVAITPFDTPLLKPVPHSYPYFEVYETRKPVYRFNTNSIGWNGDSIYNLAYPIVRDGQVIGHCWGSIKANDLLGTVLARAARTELLTMLLLAALLLAMSIIFRRLRRNISIFAHAVADGQSLVADDLLPELSILVKAVEERTNNLKEEAAEREHAQQDAKRVWDLSSDLICVFDANNQCFVKVNPAFERTLGYSEQELMTRSWRELIHPEDEGRTYQDMRHSMREHSVLRYENRYLARDGSIKWLSWTAMPDYEHPGTAYGIARDISDQKAVEAEMLRLDRLNLAGEMAASISHEIRNPMTTVRGFLQLLKGKPTYQADEEFFNIMISELDRANAIISEFLSVARNKPIEKKRGDINQVITALLPLMQADALMSGKQVEARLSQIPELLIDEKEIRQLILNLTRNGLEAMDKGGTVTISTAVEADKVALSVCDQGPGIPLELKEKIFDPFFTTKAGGTGLGLSVCYRIAQQHNAAIDVETGTEGTLFNVKFPIVVGQEKSKSAN